MKKTISVALTTYNGEKYIIELIESLLNQTKKIDEIVLCDDKSTDNTISVVKEYCLTHSINYIHVIENKKNIGWRANFRKAIENCTGEYIFLCDQDDIWKRDKIEIMFNIMENRRDIRLLVSNYDLLIDGDLERKQHVVAGNSEDGKIVQIKFVKWYFNVIRPGCTFCFRKSLYYDLKESDDISIDHDSVLWAVAIMEGSLWLIRDRLITFRRHEESATTKDSYFTLDARIKLIENLISTAKWSEFYCKKNIQGDALNKEIEGFVDFMQKRRGALMSGSLIKLIGFIISNLKYYTSIKNALADVYIAIKR